MEIKTKDDLINVLKSLKQENEDLKAQQELLKEKLEKPKDIKVGEEIKETKETKKEEKEDEEITEEELDEISKLLL